MTESAITGVARFIDRAMGIGASRWDESTLKELSLTEAPAMVGGTSYWLADADAKAQWARWFLEGFADPARFQGEVSYPHLYALVRESVIQRMPDEEDEVRNAIARDLARLAERALSAGSGSGRKPWAREVKLTLWELGNRCWICGWGFPDWAVEDFLEGKRRTERRSQSFVDFMRPRGVTAQDLEIQIDHVHPFSRGGGDEIDNLRIACGWCNRHKSAWSLMYDAPGQCRNFDHPSLGFTSVPQPFWVVRILAVRKGCEYEGGCTSSTAKSELTVAPGYVNGSPNPSNLMVVCRDHDPFRDIRLVAAELFKG